MKKFESKNIPMGREIWIKLRDEDIYTIYFANPLFEGYSRSILTSLHLDSAFHRYLFTQFLKTKI